jgi:hypothetical protein
MIITKRVITGASIERIKGKILEKGVKEHIIPKNQGLHAELKGSIKWPINHPLLIPLHRSSLSIAST